MRHPCSCRRRVREKGNEKVEIKLKLSLYPTENGKAWTKYLWVGALQTPKVHSIKDSLGCKRKEERGIE